LPEEEAEYSDIVECITLGETDDNDEISEPVFLGASLPYSIAKENEFTARFLAYVQSAEKELAELAAKLSPRANLIAGIQKTTWLTGAEVTVICSGEHLMVSEPESKFRWNGRSQIVEFDVKASADAPADTVTVLKFDVRIDNFPIARLRIDIEIRGNKITHGTREIRGEPLPTAFASYASEDRLRVLDRVSEIRKNGVDIFMDCLSLNPGEEWKPRLEKEIIGRKLFYLFWSQKAKDSRWVDWEWRTALKHKGIAGIDPHPLDPVFMAEPPTELKSLHFDDHYNMVRKAHEDKDK
jgi:hypothetical protein